MEAFLNNLYSSSTVPLYSAVILGLMIAISPCNMATSITAIGFIGRDVGNKKRVFYNGLVYTLGRTFAYTTLALILFLGANQFKISGLLLKYGEKLLGPLLVTIGVLMLGLLNIRFPAFNNITRRIQNRTKYSYWDAFLLGVLFAIAFCPYSGVLYFGILIPLTISTSGLHLPALFAITSAIPVIIFAWLIAFTVSGVGKLYNKMKFFNYWFRILVALVFISAGVYLSIKVFIH